MHKEISLKAVQSSFLIISKGTWCLSNRKKIHKKHPDGAYRTIVVSYTRDPDNLLNGAVNLFHTVEVKLQERHLIQQNCSLRSSVTGERIDLESLNLMLRHFLLCLTISVNFQCLLWLRPSIIPSGPSILVSLFNGVSIFHQTQA